LTQIVTDVISDPTLPRTSDHPCKLIKLILLRISFLICLWQKKTRSKMSE